MADEEEYVDRGDFIEGDEPEEEEVAEEVEEEEPEEEEAGEEDESEEADESDEDDDSDPVVEEEDADAPAEDEEEPVDEEEEGEEEEEEEGNARIPRSRLNQVIQQRKDKEAALEAEQERSAWLEDQLEVLIKQRSTPDEVIPEVPELEVFDFDDAEDRRDQLLMEGEMKEASALRRQISSERDKLRQHQLDTMRVEVAKEAKTTAKSELSDDKFQEAVETILTSKDYLDDTDDAYNERAVKMANSLMSSYVAEGMDRSKALAQAVEDIAPLFEDAEAEKPTKLGNKKASARTKTARKKAAKASNAQPPTGGRQSGGKGTRDLDTLDIGKMTDRDFNKLTAKERAVLRGD